MTSKWSLFDHEIFTICVNNSNMLVDMHWCVVKLNHMKVELRGMWGNWVSISGASERQNWVFPHVSSQ